MIRQKNECGHFDPALKPEPSVLNQRSEVMLMAYVWLLLSEAVVGAREMWWWRATCASCPARPRPWGRKFQKPMSELLFPTIPTDVPHTPTRHVWPAATRIFKVIVESNLHRASRCPASSVICLGWSQEAPAKLRGISGARRDIKRDDGDREGGGESEDRESPADAP